MSSRFDEYRHTYREEVEKSISFVGQDLDFFTEAKAQALLDVTRRRLGEPGNLSALDVGCGPGETDSLLGEFGDLHGVDVSTEILERARERNPRVAYAHYDGHVLPYENGTFDLAFAICVVHHVSPTRWQSFADELARVVRPGGIATIIEHNPLNPLTRLAVARCEFDADAALIGRRRALSLLKRTGLEPVESRYILFFPWRGAIVRRLEARLGALPLGAQYLAIGRRP